MTGQLGLLSLVDLFQLLVSGNRSGRLLVAHPSGAANVWFAQGRINHAEFDGHSGKNAVFALLADERGTYEFLDGEQAPRTSINDAVQELLLDAIRRTDASRSGKPRS